VSVGSQHDMIINVWDWRTRVKIGANKVSTKIKAIAFCESGDYFVTVGNRHVKFWYIQHSKQSLVSVWYQTYVNTDHQVFLFRWQNSLIIRRYSEQGSARTNW